MKTLKEEIKEMEEKLTLLKEKDKEESDPVYAIKKGLSALNLKYEISKDTAFSGNDIIIVHITDLHTEEKVIRIVDFLLNNDKYNYCSMRITFLLSLFPPLDSKDNTIEARFSNLHTKEEVIKIMDTILTTGIYDFFGMEMTFKLA